MTIQPPLMPADYERHEFLDRCHLARATLYEWLLSHAYLDRDSESKRLVEKAAEALGKAYQLVGAAHLASGELHGKIADKKLPSLQDLLDAPVNFVLPGLSVRTRNVLLSSEIKIVRDLYVVGDLKTIVNCGRSSIAEINAALSTAGLPKIHTGNGMEKM